jgi:hypothetical protein
VENLELHLGAVQFVLSVLLASHPNKAELRATFDRILSEDQIAANSEWWNRLTSGVSRVAGQISRSDRAAVSRSSEAALMYLKASRYLFFRHHLVAPWIDKRTEYH